MEPHAFIYSLYIVVRLIKRKKKQQITFQFHSRSTKIAVLVETPIMFCSFYVEGISMADK